MTHITGWRCTKGGTLIHESTGKHYCRLHAPDEGCVPRRPPPNPSKPGHIQRIRIDERRRRRIDPYYVGYFDPHEDVR